MAEAGDPQTRGPAGLDRDLGQGRQAGVVGPIDEQRREERLGVGSRWVTSR